MITLTSFQTTTILPNPQWNDSENLTSSVNVRRSMNGMVYTYVKTKNSRRKLSMTFKLTHQKGLELRAFIRSYFRSPITLVDNEGQTWSVKFTSNPFEFSTSSPSEGQDIHLEFEGVKL